MAREFATPYIPATPQVIVRSRTAENAAFAVNSALQVFGLAGQISGRLASEETKKQQAITALYSKDEQVKNDIQVQGLRNAIDIEQFKERSARIKERTYEEEVRRTKELEMDSYWQPVAELSTKDRASFDPANIGLRSREALLAAAQANGIMLASEIFPQVQTAISTDVSDKTGENILQDFINDFRPSNEVSYQTFRTELRKRFNDDIAARQIKGIKEDASDNVVSALDTLSVRIATNFPTMDAADFFAEITTAGEQIRKTNPEVSREDFKLMMEQTLAPIFTGPEARFGPDEALNKLGSIFQTRPEAEKAGFGGIISRLEKEISVQNTARISSNDQSASNLLRAANTHQEYKDLQVAIDGWKQTGAISPDTYAVVSAGIVDGLTKPDPETEVTQMIAGVYGPIASARFADYYMMARDAGTDQETIKQAFVSQFGSNADAIYNDVTNAIGRTKDPEKIKDIVQGAVQSHTLPVQPRHFPVIDRITRELYPDNVQAQISFQLQNFRTLTDSSLEMLSNFAAEADNLALTPEARASRSVAFSDAIDAMNRISPTYARENADKGIFNQKTSDLLYVSSITGESMRGLLQNSLNISDANFNAADVILTKGKNLEGETIKKMAESSYSELSLQRFKPKFFGGQTTVQGYDVPNEGLQKTYMALMRTSIAAQIAAGGEGQDPETMFDIANKTAVRTLTREVTPMRIGELKYPVMNTFIESAGWASDENAKNHINRLYEDKITDVRRKYPGISNYVLNFADVTVVNDNGNTAYSIPIRTNDYYLPTQEAIVDNLILPFGVVQLKQKAEKSKGLSIDEALRQQGEAGGFGRAFSITGGFSP